jgi:hypothetical protein
MSDSEHSLSDPGKKTRPIQQIWDQFEIIFQCLTRGTGKFILRVLSS